MLPSSLTNIISSDEKNEIKTSQENMSYVEIIEKISNECCNGDKQKGKKVYEEAINLIKSKIWWKSNNFFIALWMFFWPFLYSKTFDIFKFKLSKKWRDYK